MVETKKRVTAKKRAAAKKAAPRKKAAAARTVSSAQKKAMAEGRVQSNAVRRYLAGLDEVAGPRRRGPRRSPEQLQQRIVDITAKMRDTDPISKLRMAQEKLDIESELASATNSSVDLEALQKEFVKVAKVYGERQGISYAAWRAVGVPADVLRAAGITR